MMDLSSPLRRVEEAACDDRVDHIKVKIAENGGSYKSTPGEALTSYKTLEPILRDLLAQAWEEGVSAHVKAAQGGSEPENPYGAA